MTHFVCKPGSFDSLLSVLKTLAFPHVLLIFTHLQQSLQFISYHSEIDELSSYDKAPLVLVFSALDSSLFVAAFVLLIMKGKLSHNQYLTDSQNNIYGMVVVFSAACSCIYLFLTYDATLRDEATAETFEKNMLLAMTLYPAGPKKLLIDRIQMKYSCCGATNPIEWFSIDWYDRKSNWTQDDVPFSCCSNALQIPCIHLNMKRHTYYFKYNSSTPTIWTDGCSSKFEGVYLVDLDWLVYLGMLVATVSLVLTLLDKMILTADNNFVENGRFYLGLWAREPRWDCLIDHHNRLLQKQETPCLSFWSPKQKSVWKNMSEVVRTIDKCRKKGKLVKSRPPTPNSLLSPDDGKKCPRLQRKPKSPTNSVQSTLCEDTSASSGSSARKRKLAYFLPSSCISIKRSKKNV